MSPCLNRRRSSTLLLLAAWALTIALTAPGVARATRSAGGQGYDLSGSYFGSFERAQDDASSDPAARDFVLPKRDPTNASRDTTSKGTAVLCLCSSTPLEAPLDSPSTTKLDFAVDGVVAFLENDKIGQEYPLEGEIRCAMVQGPKSTQPLCHYAATSGAGEAGYDIDLSLDVATTMQSAGADAAAGRSHVALFNISTTDGLEISRYTGHIGAKLSALDSICDDIACRRPEVKNYVVGPERPPPKSEPEPATEKEEEEEEAAMPEPPAPVDLSYPTTITITEPTPPPTTTSEVEDDAASCSPSSCEDAPATGPLYAAGTDGSVAKNAVGKLRCGGKVSQDGSKKPDCGDQGFCMEESTGAACYWDCQPGWCACTSGTCFDQDGRCTVPATYPETNNWQATCDISNSKLASPGPEPTNIIKEVDPPVGRTEPSADNGGIRHVAGHDGARPPNKIESLRCGGEKGKPSCGDLGFCLNERTGDRCFWDCDPGWCSCNSGACFDSNGRCTETATYPESNNWQASCNAAPIDNGASRDRDALSAYVAGKDGARPPNHSGKRRCGGGKGKPDCGIQGFCMDESSGASCYWDCDPGWCSCTSGSCFDQEGKCELKASYPESNNWQATCPFY